MSEAKTKREPSASIGTQALAALVRANVDVTILDARGPDVDKVIPTAAAVEADADEDTLADLVPDTDALVVTYCGSLECPLSDKLYRRLKDLGYANVLEYDVGLKSWVEAGLETESP